MITYASISRPGSRKTNEDSIGVLERDGKYLFALADGLGEQGGGNIASAIVTSKALAVFAECTDDELREECLALCFIRAQILLMDEQRRLGRRADMKSTMVLLYIGDDSVQWGHIGDSRLYIIKDGREVSRTKDHSVPQMLVHTGEIREEEIRFHPERSRLLKVMGVEWNVPRFELSGEAPLSTGTAFLLCSDGFWELIDEKDMYECLKSAADPGEWLAAMEKIVIRNGDGRNMDNYSAIAVLNMDSTIPSQGAVS